MQRCKKNRHLKCKRCKRCYYGDEPIFPYPNIEDEYYDDPYSRTRNWETDYPLIKIYNEEWNKFDDERERKHEKETYLSKCPLCRA